MTNHLRLIECKDTCKYDLERSACDKVANLIDPSVHCDCNIEDSLNILVDQGNKENLLKADKLLNKKPPSKSNTKYHCKILDTTITYSCSNNHCKYWIDFKPSDNCLLAHANKLDQDSFSVEEISYLTKLNLKSIEATLTDTFNKVRASTVKTSILSEDLAIEFVLVPNSYTCVACESFIDETKLSDKHGFLWCSKECLEEVPVREVDVEHRFGVPVQTIITWVDQQFCKAKEDILEIQLPYLAQYLNMEVADFVKIYKKYGTKNIVKTTSAEIVSITTLNDGVDYRAKVRSRRNQAMKFSKQLKEKYIETTLDLKFIRILLADMKKVSRC